MDTESTSSHLVDTLQHLFSYGETRRKDTTLSGGHADGFTLALGREAGTGGTAIAAEVGKRLGWRVYDHELLEQIARDMGLRTKLLESVDERKQSWLRESIEAFVSAPRKSDWGPLVTENNFVHHLVKTVLALGAHGKCVIVGRGAAFILPPETTLRVRLVGPLRERIAALAHRLGISEREAVHEVRKLDREHIDFVKDHFCQDPTDPHHYDVILNTSRLSVAQCADVIVQALQHMEAVVTEKGKTESTLLNGFKRL